jgi:hypothetical protein
LTSGSESSPLAWAAIDFLCCLLLVVYTLIAPPHHPTSVETLGAYAIEVTWPASRDDDIDTWVEDPAGNVVSFTNRDAGLMHLDHDDLGQSSDRLRYGTTIAVVRHNEERVVVRGVLPGEMTVNVHAYRMAALGPCPVTVRLWRLRGEDVLLLRRSLTLAYTGEQETAFRFTLDRSGTLRGHNTLSKDLVGTSGGRA